jgi:hypothetical protein
VQLNLKHVLLLAKDSFGLTALDVTVYNSKKEILKKLWVWGRGVEINFKHDLLLAKSEDGLTA